MDTDLHGWGTDLANSASAIEARVRASSSFSRRLRVFSNCRSFFSIRPKPFVSGGECFIRVNPWLVLENDAERRTRRAGSRILDLVALIPGGAKLQAPGVSHPVPDVGGIVPGNFGHFRQVNHPGRKQPYPFGSSGDSSSFSAARARLSVRAVWDSPISFMIVWKTESASRKGRLVMSQRPAFPAHFSAVA
jgi:hypothetical protein